MPSTQWVCLQRTLCLLILLPLCLLILLPLSLALLLRRLLRLLVLHLLLLLQRMSQTSLHLTLPLALKLVLKSV